MSKVILDASALLALLNDEPGADEVAQYIPGAAISTVNLSEAVAKLADSGMPEDAIREAIGILELKILPFDESLAYRAGLLRLLTREIGFSFGDRACVATGLDVNAPVLTADQIWEKIELPVEIRLIR
ncbi:MAG: type II toxin-antitoxin system VapC family toxin [bacterium]|nr:type II toxin-antitoxin system VapC family toxin [bacterium]